MSRPSTPFPSIRTPARLAWGGLLLPGALAWFLYVGASDALSAVAYKELFRVYVARFRTSLDAFVLAFVSVDVDALAARRSSRLLGCGPGSLMLASGIVVLAVWLMAPATSLLTGEPPARLGAYTTLFTNTLDMAIIAPAAVLAGVRILRRATQGYLIALALRVVEAMLAPMIAAQTVSQLSAGVHLTPAEIVGPLAGFVILSLLPSWVLWAILGRISESTPVKVRRG